MQQARRAEFSSGLRASQSQALLLFFGGTSKVMADRFISITPTTFDTGMLDEKNMNLSRCVDQ
jgi:hypothetical protein